MLVGCDSSATLSLTIFQSASSTILINMLQCVILLLGMSVALDSSSGIYSIHG